MAARRAYASTNSLLDVREIRHVHLVELAVRRVVDRFVESVRADADGTPAQIVLADVDRIQRRVPRCRSPRDDLGFCHRVVSEFELRDIGLADRYFLRALVGWVCAFGREEDVFVGGLRSGRKSTRWRPLLPLPM